MRRVREGTLQDGTCPRGRLFASDSSQAMNTEAATRRIVHIPAVREAVGAIGQALAEEGVVLESDCDVVATLATRPGLAAEDGRAARQPADGGPDAGQGERAAWRQPRKGKKR